MRRAQFIEINALIRVILEIFLNVYIDIYRDLWGGSFLILKLILTFIP